MLTEQQIYAILQNALVNLFELDADKITADAHLYDDLDIDSIDAIDLIDYVKRETGYKLAAEDFRHVRTVGDIIAALLKKQSEPAENDPAENNGDHA